MKLIIFVLSLLLSTELGEAKGWVSTKESAACVRYSGTNREAVSDCYYHGALFLESLIEKKLQPNYPHGKHDLVWWHQRKKKINQQCIQEVKKYEKDVLGINDEDSTDRNDQNYDHLSVNMCLEDAYADLNRSLVHYEWPIIKP